MEYVKKPKSSYSSLSGTIEINPGPVKTKKNNFSFAVWDLDSIPARDYERIPLIESFQSTYNFDIFGQCESILSDVIPNEDILINFPKPENSRNGVVCIYFKGNLSIKYRRKLETIPGTIVAKVKLNRKIIFFFRTVILTCHQMDLKTKKILQSLF